MFTGMENLSRGMHFKRQEPDQLCRFYFWLKFGITPDEQVAIEEHYDGIKLEWSEPSRAEGLENIDLEILELRAT